MISGEAFLTGVSYMLPFVVAGGILVALGFLLGGYNIPNEVDPGTTFASSIFWIGKIGLDNLMVPVLGAYVGYSIADKPGICVECLVDGSQMTPWSNWLQIWILRTSGCRNYCRLSCQSFEKDSTRECFKIFAADSFDPGSWMCRHRSGDALCHWNSVGSADTDTD